MKWDNINDRWYKRVRVCSIAEGNQTMLSEFAYLAYKVIWTAAKPGNLLVLMLTCGVSLVLFGHGATATVGEALIGVSLLSMLSVLILPVGTWLLAPLEMRHPFPEPIPDEVAGIVVVGGAVEPRPARVHGAISMNAAAERMMAVPLLAHRFPDAKIVFTGGDAQHRAGVGTTAAEISERYFIETGLSGPKLFFEGASRNTRENALLTKALVAPRHGETWLLVTSAWHMPRAVRAFRAVGWTVTPYPVDYRSNASSGTLADLSFTHELKLVEIAMQEWIGLAFYRLVGWI